MTGETNEDEKFPGIEEAILWVAYEESDLFEVVWELNTRYPSVPPLERIRMAKSIVSDLLRKKWIALFRYERPRGKWEEIDQSQWQSVIDLSDNWEPTCPWRYLIDVTEDGKRQIMRPDDP